MKFNIFNNDKCNIINIITSIEGLRIEVEHLKRKSLYDISESHDQSIYEEQSIEESKHQSMHKNSEI